MHSQLTPDGLDSLTLHHHPACDVWDDPGRACTCDQAVGWVIELRAQVGDVPPTIRLRQALKYLRRVQGLVCTSVSPKPQPIAPARHIGGDDE